MMDLNNVHNVYFIGIGGIGMSAIALYFNSKKCEVSGYDKAHSSATDILEKIGIKIFFEVNESHIPDSCDLIVYTPAISDDNAELKYAKQFRANVLKRADVLSFIVNDLFCVAIAGAHGKTTTTTMLAHILAYNNFPLIAFIGGISKNFNSNFYSTHNPKIALVEADEYDRSFLKLNPSITVVNAVEADHLDIYKNFDSLCLAYQQFSSIAENCNRFVNANYNQYFNVDNTYGFCENSKCKITNYYYLNGLANIELSYIGNKINFDKLPIYGKHNVLNFCAAYFVAKSLNVTDLQIENAMLGYKGVQRRFDINYNNGEIVYIDDYAHHPTEIESLKIAIDEVFPNKKVCAFFQPHLYSRTKDFMDDLVKVLQNFDELFLLDIYPAREKPIEGISSELLARKISPITKVINKNEIIDAIGASNAEIFVTVGAGDIDDMTTHIKNFLSVKYGKDQ